jgi:hypothetical protein
VAAPERRVRRLPKWVKYLERSHPQIRSYFKKQGAGDDLRVAWCEQRFPALTSSSFRSMSQCPQAGVTGHPLRSLVQRQNADSG